jgi:hypothetical protein
VGLGERAIESRASEGDEFHRRLKERGGGREEEKVETTGVHTL